MPVASAPSPVTTYAAAVVADEIVANHYVRLACERHQRDLTEGASRGITFDADAAAHAIGFFAFLRLSEGAFASQPFTLEPFQEFIVGSLFGWKKADTTRRFRTAYVEIAKGNGKSPLAGAIGLYGMIADGEPGAHIYSAAVTREQASILFTDAKNMVEASSDLTAKIEVNVGNLRAGTSFFRPVSSEKRGLDGKRVHMALIDELHEHRTGTVVDKMRAGTKNRRSPLVFENTNAGYDRESVCWDHHQYSVQILEGTVQNDSWFAFVCGLDAGDDWWDPAVWPKANPGLGTILPASYLEEQVQEAQEIRSKQNIVRRLNFCEWTEQAERWLDVDVWTDQPARTPLEELEGRPCYAGLDLSTTTDLSALVLVFPDVEGGFDVVPYFWMPEDNARLRQAHDAVPYLDWIADGHIEATPGSVVDYDVIRARVNELGQRFNIREVPTDPWNSTQLQTQLEGDGFTVFPFRQGYQTMSDPTKQLEKLLLERKFRHGDHPVLRWMASNVAVMQDAAGNLKPAKDKSTERIDGIVAAIMGLGRALASDGPAPSSIYETRGVLVL